MTATRYVLVALLTALLAGCSGGSDDGATKSGLLKVVATTSIIADTAARIGGDDAQVTGLMGPGVDPHLYKASEGDVRRLQEADVVLYNGLHLEARMGEVLERMGDGKSAAVTDGLPVERLLSPPGALGTHDPHVWFDVGLWIHAAKKVCDALVAADPDHAENYRTRAAELTVELATLDAEVRTLAARVPVESRVLVTAHDAFGYFGRAYGFEVRGLQGISTATEAGARDVQQLAAYIADHRIPAVFVETSVPPRAIEAVRAAVRARGFEVGLGGELFSDALGDADSDAGTYIGMVRHNVRTIVGALTGDAEALHD
jgi:manganese/zinc/iron transport system substrate-binding protein